MPLVSIGMQTTGASPAASSVSQYWESRHANFLFN
jgi:hypothetical protein